MKKMDAIIHKAIFNSGVYDGSVTNDPNREGLTRVEYNDNNTAYISQDWRGITY